MFVYGRGRGGDVFVRGKVGGVGLRCRPVFTCPTLSSIASPHPTMCMARAVQPPRLSRVEGHVSVNLGHTCSCLAQGKHLLSPLPFFSPPLPSPPQVGPEMTEPVIMAWDPSLQMVAMCYSTQVCLASPHLVQLLLLYCSCAAAAVLLLECWLHCCVTSSLLTTCLDSWRPAPLHCLPVFF